MPSRATRDPLEPGDILADLRKFNRRRAIIEEEELRRQVARDNALRQRDPAEWKRREQSRLTRNRDAAAINRRLRSERLQPIELEPSLSQRVKKLQQLEARNHAESATRKAPTSRRPRQSQKKPPWHRVRRRAPRRTRHA